MEVMVTTHTMSLDDVVHEIYPNNPHMLLPVTEVNTHTLSIGVHFPAGTTINLPTLTETTKTQQTINLWD